MAAGSTDAEDAAEMAAAIVERAEPILLDAVTDLLGIGAGGDVLRATSQSANREETLADGNGGGSGGGGAKVGWMIRHAETDADRARCFTVMRELRPDEREERAFVARMRRLAESGGYAMAMCARASGGDGEGGADGGGGDAGGAGTRSAIGAAGEAAGAGTAGAGMRGAAIKGAAIKGAAGDAGGEVIAVAAWHVGENLAWGRFLYLDDLVVRESDRGSGAGSAMIDWLGARAAEAGLESFHLDSGVQRFGAHRFYQGKGFDITSHHFAKRV